MNRRQKTGLIVIGLLLAGVLVFFLMNNKQVPDEPAAEPSSDIGILDMQAVASHHPDYSRLRELRREINTLQAELESMQMLEMTQPEQAQVNPERLAQAEGDMAIQKNMMTDTAAMKDIQQKRFELRKAAGDEMAAAVEEVNNIYMPQIFNIQLKLENLRLDDEVRQKYEADRQALYGQREAAIQERQQAIDAKYMTELDNYAASVQERAAAQNNEQLRQQAEASAEHSAAIAQRNEAAAREQQSRLSPQEVAANQQAIEAKEREAAELEDKISSDITAKAMKVAIEHNLKAVIAPKRHVNISAVDITDFVIEEFNS